MLDLNFQLSKELSMNKNKFFHINYYGLIKIGIFLFLISPFNSHLAMFFSRSCLSVAFSNFLHFTFNYRINRRISSLLVLAFLYFFLLFEKGYRKSKRPLGPLFSLGLVAPYPNFVKSNF